MVTSKNSTLKKVIFIAFSLLLVLACLYFVTGCSLFDDDDDKGLGTDPDPDKKPIIDVTEMQTPQRARFDAVTSTLYVSDCSAGGITFYRVEQRVLNYGNNNKRTLGELDTTNLKTENGFFAIPLKNLISNDSSFEITVWCFKKASDREGYTKKFTFLCGGKIEYDVEHCAFNNDTGEFTWTAVDGASGYAVTVDGSDEAVTVTEPKFTVDESTYSFAVVPLFEEDNLYGRYVTFNLYGDDVVDAISYDEKRGAFYWSRRLDCTYTVRITDGGTVVEDVAQPVTDFGMGYAVFYYTPTTESVTVQVSSSSPISRPCTGDAKTFDVYFGPTDIAIGKTSGELTWNKIKDFSDYVVVLDYEDGTTETANTKSEKLNFSTKYSISGAVTARIRVNVNNRSCISLFSEPFEFSVLNPVDLKPEIDSDVDNNKLSVSVKADTKNVLGYDVTFISDSGEQTVKLDCADAVDGIVSATQTVPLYEVVGIRVSRRFNGTEGRIYFKGDFDDFTRDVMVVDRPEVEVTDKNAQSGNALGFTVNISFPKALIGKGQLTVSYRYESKLSDAVSGSNKISDDYIKFFSRPKSENGMYSLKVYFSKFERPDGSEVWLYRNIFQTTVTALNRVKISAADASQIEWQPVSDADQYVVEKKDPDGNTQTVRTAEKTCSHVINGEGEYVYYITPISNDPFVMDGERFMCVVEKLIKPTVTIASDGTISAESNKFNIAVVTALDGEKTSPTQSAVRDAFTDKTEVSLVAYNSGVNTSSRFYIDSDEVTYTLHRIADVDSSSLGFAVNAPDDLVTWTDIAGARDYNCRLFRRENESDEFALDYEFTQDIAEIDGKTLRWGYYRLEVKPLSYSANNDFYIYFGDHADGMFSKDGISSVAWSGGYVFTMTDGCFANIHYIAYRAVTFDDGQPMQYGNGTRTVDLSRHYSNVPTRTVGMHKLTFALPYRNESELSAEKILKADDYVLPFEVRRSETPEVESGSYSFTNSQDNSAVNEASVEVVPVTASKTTGYYSVVHRIKHYDSKTAETTKVSETDGLITTVTVSGEYFNLFTLRVNSEKFLSEDDGLVYYMSSYESESSYSFAANEVYTATVADVEASNDYIYITLNINYDDYDDGDIILAQCLAYTGAWTNPEDYYVKDIKDGKIEIRIKKSVLKLDRDIIIRIVHHSKRVKGGVIFDNSCWYFISVALPQ